MVGGVSGKVKPSGAAGCGNGGGCPNPDKESQNRAVRMREVKSRYT
jgi:hypothetical protein